jgi:hypothetical protein
VSSSSQGTAKKPTGRSWKRRYPRHRIDLPIKVTVLGADGYHEVRGRCGDMGEGGVGTILGSEIEPGEVVGLEIQIGEVPPMSVRAIVRYRKGLVHGLEFLGLAEEQRQVILQLCAAAAPLD